MHALFNHLFIHERQNKYSKKHLSISGISYKPFKIAPSNPEETTNYCHNKKDSTGCKCS
jgi:hypothetical protein